MSNLDVENLHSCLSLVREIRANSGNLFRAAEGGVGGGASQDAVENGVEEEEKMFVKKLKVKLDDINAKMSDLDQNLSSHPTITTPIPLGYSIYLSLDAVVENSPVYTRLVNSYKWIDKAHKYSASAAAILGQNSLNRSYGKMMKSSRRRQNNPLQTANPHALDNLILTLGRTYQDMTLRIRRPNETKLNALVLVSLSRTLKAVLVFKGLMIEWVVVKAFHEDIIRPTDGQVDVWSESKYEVFRRISQNANAAMLNFQSAVYPELSVKSFVTYLHSFTSLFSHKCKQCGNHLYNNVPPTWREFKTLEPYHEDCRP